MRIPAREPAPAPINDSMDAARALVKEFGVDWSEARKAVEQEAEEIREHAKPRRITYSDATQKSYERIRDWIRESGEYRVDLTWRDVAKFHSDHRPACVWAVLIGKSLTFKG